MASMQATAVSDALGPTVAAAAASAVAATTTAPAAPHAAAAVASAAAAAATLPAAADVAQSSQRSRNTRLQSSLNVRSSSFPDPNPPPLFVPVLVASDLRAAYLPQRDASKQNKCGDGDSREGACVGALELVPPHTRAYTYTHTQHGSVPSRMSTAAALMHSALR